MTRPPFEAALLLKDIRHRFGAKWALQGVELEVRPGEIVALLGPSGCGKTTLLRLIAGLERAQAGRIELSGRLMAWGEHFVEPEQRGIGLMFQDYALFPHLSVIENVSFGLHGMPRADARRRAEVLLRAVGLPDRAGAYPHMLSGGEQQRIALARALAPHPSLLLMDEPFSNLDLRLRRRLRQETAALLRATAAAAIIVLHDTEDALAVADRIALMDAGRLVQFDVPQAFFQRPANLFVARFFSDLEELATQVRAGAAETPLGRFALPEAGDGPAWLALPRSAFRLATQQADFEGEVLEARFMGEHLRLSLRVRGLPEPLDICLGPQEAILPGRHLGVTIDRSRVLLFPHQP